MKLRPQIALVAPLIFSGICLSTAYAKRLCESVGEKSEKLIGTRVRQVWANRNGLPHGGPLCHSHSLYDLEHDEKVITTTLAGHITETKLGPKLNPSQTRIAFLEINERSTAAKGLFALKVYDLVQSKTSTLYPDAGLIEDYKWTDDSHISYYSNCFAKISCAAENVYDAGAHLNPGKSGNARVIRRFQDGLRPGVVYSLERHMFNSRPEIIAETTKPIINIRWGPAESEVHYDVSDAEEWRILAVPEN